MNSSDTRVSSYLDDLARMLADLDPADRDEVLAGVREHLDATLAEHPDDPAAVDAALLRLGPPERVAAEARAELAPPTPSSPKPLPARGWLVAALVLLLATSAPFTLGTAIERVVDLASRDAPESMFGLSTTLLPTAPLMVFTWPLWVGGMACAFMARRRAPRTWGLLLAVGPVAFLGSWVAMLWREPVVLSAVVAVVACAALTVLAVVVAQRVWREARTT